MIQKLQKAWMTMAVTALVLCGFAVSSQAQLVTDWERNARTGAAEAKPDWFGAGTERGLAYGVVDGTPVVYVVNRPSALRAIDPDTGADIDLGANAFDFTGVAGGLFAVNDVAVSEDGVVFVSNMTLDASNAANPFKVYIWETPGGTFDKVYSFTSASALRFGDKFTVVGNWSEGTAEIWASAAGTPGTILRATTADNGDNWTTNLTTLSGTPNTVPANSNVTPTGLGGNADFYINGNGANIRRYASDGAYVEGANVATTGSMTGVKYFEQNGKSYVTAYLFREVDTDAAKIGYVRVWDVTDPLAPELVASSPKFADADGGNHVNGDVDFRLNEDGTFTLFGLGTDQGIGAFSTEPEVVIPELFTEYFEYPIGSLLTENGWTAHSGAGTNSPAVVGQTLSYDGYAGSGLGNVTGLTTGEDVHRNTGTYTSGNVYASALVNLSAVTTAGDYFLHFGPETIGSTFRGRVFARGDGAGNVAFGISKAGGIAAADVTGFNYALNQNILLVLEYQFVDGADNDIVNLYVNPVGPELPGTPDATDNAGTDLADLGSIALRQAAANAPTLVIGNLRVGSDYAEVVGDPAAPVIPSNFVASLSGLNEVPANLSAGMGDISLILAGDELVVTGTFSGLGSDYTMSHIHAGVAGTNGGVVVALTPTLDGDNRGGTYEAANNVFTLTQEQIDAMAAGQYYVNVHSVDFPAGEIRGQIYADPNTAPSQVAITAPADGASVTIEGNPLTPFTATWEAATDDEGHPVNYVWQLAADDLFETIVVNANVGSAASFTTDFQTVDAILAGAGVPDGGSITVYHRAVATDGSLLTAGTGASVTLTRGELDEPITIAEARGLAVGTPVFVEGIITTPDFGFNSAEFYVQDETAGIKVRWVGFGGGNTDTPFADGQQVRLAGEISERFAELLIGPSGYEIVSSGNDLPVPVAITRADWTIDTPLQGSRVKVSGLSLVDPAQWPTSTITSGSGVTVQATDADGNIYDIRIDRDESEFEASPLPPAVFNLSGVLGRFNDNAQLFPFFADELEGVFSPLAGDYYVPQGSNQQGFSTLAMAIEAVNQAGLAGHANILIDADLNEGSAALRINRGDLTADTRLTIKPAPGKQVTVHAADFRLVDTGYITVDGSADGDGARNLTFVKNSSSGGFIGLFSNTLSIELKNFNVTYDENYGLNTYAFIINRRESGTTDTGRAEDVLIENLQVGSAEKPFSDGFWLFGSTTIAEFFHVNVTFRGNEFHVGRSALRTQTHTNTVFTGNVVRNYGTTDAGLIEAVRLNTPIETFTFTNNEIVFVGTTRTAATTFVGLNGTNSLVESVAVYNNTFSNAGFAGEGTEHSFVGFRHDGGASSATFRLFHNSFRLGDTGNSGLQAAVGKNAGASGAASVNVVNNIIVNERDAENSYAYQWTGGGFSADYNNIVTAGEWRGCPYR
jgi:hypothetical protein